MKLNLNAKKITITFFTIVSGLFIACTSDDPQPDPVNEDLLSIPDIHFETKLIEQGIDTDGIINHQMSKSDAEAISRLDLNLFDDNGDISNLTGIEGFVNLKFLSSSGPDLAQIDLRNNTLLDTLNLWGNNISYIDLSNNPDLIYVNVGANNLDSISGLSSSTHLIELDLSWNYFEEFDLNNASVEILFMSHNDLTSINTNGATNLKNAMLTSNKLATIDFSTNGLLETLLISDNKIANIDLSNNSNLTHLYITSNLLNNMDVSNNQKLVDLRIDRNPDLACIKVLSGQNISFVSLSDYQALNTDCN